MNTIEEMNREFNAQPFYKRLAFSKTSSAFLDTFTSGAIQFKGYCENRENFCIEAGDDEYYVYLWKHLDGDIFYVGSGKNNRWLTHLRKDSFMKEIDKGDAVVYKVVSGLNKSSSLLYERYISGSLCKAGYVLANRDNIIKESNRDLFDEWILDNSHLFENDLTKHTEQAVSKIIYDREFSWKTLKNIKIFKQECGEHYFSEGYYRNLWVQEV